jgi:hypothetical protein
MPATRAVITIPAVSGVARDAVKFDFAFANPSSAIDTNIVTFFSFVNPTWSTSISGFLSPTLAHTSAGCLLQLYDLTGHLDGTATGHPPYHQTTFTLPGGGGSPLPSELAVVLSYHADFTGIPEHAPHARPRARYRGRLYIGPMATSALDSDSTTHRPRIAQNVRETVAAGAVHLSQLEPTWSVWSRTDATMRQILQGSIDDAWDVQRSRGEDPLNRTFWNAGFP